MLSVEDATNLIKVEFPEFSVDSIDFMDEGWDSCVFEINGKYIFRFPKYEDSVECLKREICLLPKLAEHLGGLKIPRFEFIAQNSLKPGECFVGYEKIPGKILEKETHLALSNSQKREVANQLASFLSAIHAFPLSEAKACGIQEESFQNNYQESFDEAREHVFHSLSEKQQQYVTNVFENYLSDSENFNYEPVLLHADIGPSHILHANGKIVGVIDFGDVVIGDPDYDYMFLFDQIGEAIVKDILEFLPHKDTQHLFKKLKFFALANKIEDYLHGPTEDWRKWAWENIQRKLTI